MQDILKALIRGAGPSGSTPAGGDAMGQILRSILQGATAPAQSGTPGQAQPRNLPASGSHSLIDLLGSILGGVQNAQGGQASTAVGNPLAQLLAERLGIPPQLAEVIVAFFLSKVMSRVTGGAQQPAEFRRSRTAPDEINLDHLLENANDKKALTAQLNQSGMAQELAQQTGMSPQAAGQSLQALVKLLSEQRQSPVPLQPQKVDLKHLLDTWR